MAIVLGGLAAVTALARNGLASAASGAGGSTVRRLAGAAPLASAVVIIAVGVATTVGALGNLYGVLDDQHRARLAGRVAGIRGRSGRGNSVSCTVDDAGPRERIRDGDREALGELYDRHAAQAFAVAFRVRVIDRPPKTSSTTRSSPSGSDDRSIRAGGSERGC